MSEELPPAPKRTRGRVTRRKQEPQVDDEVAEEVEDVCSIGEKGGREKNGRDGKEKRVETLKKGREGSNVFTQES